MNEEPIPGSNPQIPNAGTKALILLATAGAALIAFALYVMAARGVFAQSQQLVLVAESAEGVVEGMSMSFAGFPIGRVVRISLADDGKAKLLVAIPREDAKWLRSSSVFTLERGPLGDARLRAFTGLRDDPPLEDGAKREVLIGDASAGVAQLMATAKQLLENMTQLTAEGSALSMSLNNMRSVSTAMTGRYGALAAVLGSDAHAQKVITTVDSVNALVRDADSKLFGKNGLSDRAQDLTTDLRTTLQETTAILREARASLQKVDALLVDAKAIAANARVASEDIDVLRHDLQGTLTRVSGLIDELNRRWPLSRDLDVKLP